MCSFNSNKIYIASKIGFEKNEKTGSQKTIHSSPVEYNFSYMPASSQVDYRIYGDIVDKLYVSYLDRQFYEGKIKRLDRVYLIDGDYTESDIEILAREDMNNKYCPNANYSVKIVSPQARRIKVVFEKIA